MQPQMFSSELQFISTTMKLFHFEQLAIAIWYSKMNNLMLHTGTFELVYSYLSNKTQTLLT